MKRGRETKPCNNIPDRPSNSIPMPEVKEPKKGCSGITIDMDCSGLDEALDKARSLLYVLEEVNRLQKQIIKDAEDIDWIANKRLAPTNR